MSCFKGSVLYEQTKEDKGKGYRVIASLRTLGKQLMEFTGATEDERLAALFGQKLQVSSEIRQERNDYSQPVNQDAVSMANIYKSQLEEMRQTCMQELEKLQVENQILRKGFQNLQIERNQYKCAVEELKNSNKELEKALQEARLKNYALNIHLSQALGVR